jgi:hypothetical protein
MTQRPDHTPEEAESMLRALQRDPAAYGYGLYLRRTGRIGTPAVPPVARNDNAAPPQQAEVDEQPAFVASPDVASPLVNVGEAVLIRRAVPCICPQQEDGACGRTVGYSTGRGLVVEQIACDRCPRSWTRINA